MFNLAKYLEKFSRNISENNINKKEIIDILFKNTNITFDIKEIDIKNNVIYINTTPIKKNKIFINKQKILEDFSSISVKIIDIR